MLLKLSVLQVGHSLHCHCSALPRAVPSPSYPVTTPTETLLRGLSSLMSCSKTAIALPRPQNTLPLTATVQRMLFSQQNEVGQLRSSWGTASMRNPNRSNPVHHPQITDHFFSQKSVHPSLTLDRLASSLVSCRLYHSFVTSQHHPPF